MTEKDFSSIPESLPQVGGESVFQMFRHGDILIRRVQEQIPEGLDLRADKVVALGEATGHKHEFKFGSEVALYGSLESQLFIQVTGDEGAVIVHPEHKPISLPEGVYVAWQQREYSPKAIRMIWD